MNLGISASCRAVLSSGATIFALGACDGASSSGDTDSDPTGGKGAANSSGTGGSRPASTTPGGGDGSCTPSTEPFSFFVTSQARLFERALAFNGSTKGFGGDLRYGETGSGAGLLGADRICSEIAEASMPGNCKVWRAFLSTTTEDAIDRIGNGRWHDRIGRLFGDSPTEIVATRPPNANTAIRNDFPNEDGVLNHDALQSGNTSNQDNHDMLTGSNASGRLYNGTASNCNDWTSLETSLRPRVGHSWPTSMGGGVGGPTGMDGGVGGMGDLSNWISALDENGCAPGVNLAMSSMPDGRDGTVGGGGGYGGFYCFALSP